MWPLECEAPEVFELGLLGLAYLFATPIWRIVGLILLAGLINIHLINDFL